MGGSPCSPYDPGRYWNERLDRDFSLAGVGHTGVGLAFNRWAYQIRRCVLRRVLSAHALPGPEARLLELGFGTGFYLDLWRQLGVRRLTCFDIAEVAVRQARERFKGLDWHIGQADIGTPLDLGGQAGQFSMATAFDILFHLVDDTAWQGALDNLARALGPGGFLLLSEKLPSHLSARSHVKRRTMDAYRTALTGRGFEVVGVWPVFFFMNSPGEGPGMGPFFCRAGWSLLKLPYRLGRRVGLGEPLGGVAGACAFPLEWALGRLCPSGPGTKILLARKKG